tara:strand:+ start:24 stop:644 length:621 start_codon:yes stop_codon:yes gene_type:complete
MSIVKLNNRGVKNATAFGSITGLGSMTLIKKLTASSSATLSFVDGSSGVVLDNTYKEYVFTFKDIHPATDNQDIQFNGSVDGGSNYNVTKTSTTFQAQHDEADSEALLQYNTDRDLAQSTSAQRFSLQIGNDNDQSVVGTLHLFNPSSTTFVKHYIATVQGANAGNYTQQLFTAGYMNTTNAVNSIQFSFQSGNIDAGDICLYGIA